MNQAAKNKTLRLAVSGASGRMGQTIVRLGNAAKDLQVAATLDRDLPTKLSQLKGQVDVLIDFTLPEATMSYAEEALKLKLPMVISTTGFSESQTAHLYEISQSIPMVLAPNMSLGMNLLSHYAGRIAKALGNDFDIDIVDLHHNQKQDSPSGSAKGIAAQILAAKELAFKGYPATEAGLRQRDGYPRFQVIRSGGVVGDHQVIFGSQHESIILQHRALSREVFANGSLHAARWLVGKPAGLYTMFDVLDLK
jgi:4-hydroxy-tetrahydrodipicolinate reductase